MARIVRFDQPNDTCMFTPLQLQPVTAFRIGMSTWARWLSAHLASFPALVRDHELGAVVVGAHVTWVTPCGFFDSDGVRTEGRVTIVNQRGLFREDFRVFAVGGRADGQTILDGIGIMRPLHVGREAGLGATPIPVPPAVLDKLEPDEIDDTAIAPRPVTDAMKRVAGAAPLAEGEVRSFCSRALSEVADQWSFVEVPSLAAYGRETLVLAAGKTANELRRGLRSPLRSVNVEYKKPVFAFDELVVRTRAYAQDGELWFLHAVHTTSDPDPRAHILERF
jgi:hypothetical protein